ncbi:MAG TPA: hypothetical protein VHE61_12255 [Opitutaceae bacterium]|nr:hypothetical protein [Opitutaceae bacterium]
MSLSPPPSGPDDADRLARLEARLARLEAHLGLPPAAPTSESASAGPAAPATPVPTKPTTDSFEVEVGQTWFARAGILALAVGAASLLTRPYPDLPAALPPLAGFAVTIALFAGATTGRKTFPLVAGYLRAAAMALLYCSALRLFFFGRSVLPAGNVAVELVVLAAVSLVNLGIAWRRGSPWLMALAFITAMETPLAVDRPGVVLGGVVLFALIAALIGAQRPWTTLLPVGVALTFTAYFLWAIGNPLHGGDYHWATRPGIAPLVLLACTAVFGTVPFGRDGVTPDQPAPAFAAVLNASLGYVVFLLHTAAVSDPNFAVRHALAAGVFVALAAMAWHRHRSVIATFFYAMCGYTALGIAITKASAVPDVFVWLSAESVLVVATAIWFRSRFIVVANFLIYVAVVLAYVVLNNRETGISIGFGIVALVSARVLNWQRHRLALKTELMRNAYLIGAFIIFPYALAHLSPPRFTALAWVALAVLYYALNVIIRNQKYRWMGHGTLLLTTVYVIIPHPDGLTAAQRVLSVLVLGVVLLTVSLTSSWQHRKRE